MKSSNHNLLFVIAVILFLLGGMTGYGRQADSFLVKPYLQYVTQDKITILWETTAEGSTIVEYGEALLDPKEPNLSQQATKDGRRSLHEVRLQNLKPATKYLYRVRTIIPNSNQEIVSEVYTFSTAVNDDDAFYFAFIGDTQENPRTPWAWARVSEQIFGKRPNFIVHAGDLVDQGHEKFHWTDRFFKKGQQTLSRYPMFTTLGNHENDAQYYYDYMANPAPEYYYTIKFGNAQFFFIDTNRDVSEGSEQYLWLEGALAISESTWKFVVHHHPPYSTEENDHGNSWIGLSHKRTHARDLVPLYETYGVDFCLFGHTHVYERTWPIFKDAINMKKGVIYINSGGAGGGLEDLDPVRSWFSREMQQKVHHYCTFAIHDKYVAFNAIDTDNNIFDSFQLTKEGNRVSVIQPPAPLIKAENTTFIDDVKIELETRNPAVKTFYTTDGSEPTQQSTRYDGPFYLKESTELKTRSYNANGHASRVLARKFNKQKPIAPVKTKNLKEGVRYAFYNVEDHLRKLPDFSKLVAASSGSTPSVTEDVPGAEYHYGLVIDGYFYVAETKVYKLFTNSDDGSKLFVNDALLVDNDGNHGMQVRSNSIALQKGWHRFKIEYYQGGGGKGLQFGRLVDGEKMPFFPTALKH